MKKYFTMLLIVLAALFAVPTTTAEAAAKKPTQVTVNVGDPEDPEWTGQLVISWTDKNKSKVKKYIIYRSDDNGANYKKIGQSKITEYWDDTIKESGIYFYKIKTVLKNGTKSKMSKAMAVFASTSDEESDIDDDENVSTSKKLRDVKPIYLEDSEIPTDIYSANYKLVQYYGENDWMCCDPYLLYGDGNSDFIYDMKSLDDIVHNMMWMYFHENWICEFYIPSSLWDRNALYDRYCELTDPSIAYKYPAIEVFARGRNPGAQSFSEDADFLLFCAPMWGYYKGQDALCGLKSAYERFRNKMQPAFHEKYILPLLYTEEKRTIEYRTVVTEDMREEFMTDGTGYVNEDWADRVPEYVSNFETFTTYVPTGITEAEIEAIYRENWFKEYPYDYEYGMNLSQLSIVGFANESHRTQHPVFEDSMLQYALYCEFGYIELSRSYKDDLQRIEELNARIPSEDIVYH